ncbi:MAG: YbaK/EbsC family protein [Clostridia bacterium]|nr:YbaK/EbsC family protein [Clostridia bacterium]
MSPIERVRESLRGYGAEDRLMEFDVSTATVELAAEAVGCEPGRIAKTLSFMAGAEPVFVVAAGDRRIDNRKFKDRFAAKAKMMTAEELDRLTGLHFGGVCPFGLPDTVHLYLDESLRDWDVIYPAGGTESSAVRVTPEELERFTGARGWVDVCKPAAGE